MGLGRRGVTGMLSGLRGMSTTNTGVSICYMTVPDEVRNALRLPNDLIAASIHDQYDFGVS